MSALADELERDLGSASELAAVGRSLTTLGGLVQDARQQLERSRSAAVITLVGSTGAGKSTLLNALVGHAIAREGEDRPTTSAPVIYRPRDADLGDLLDGLPEAEGRAKPRIVEYDAATEGIGGTRWSGQVLIDAPDTNSVETLHREVVAALAARSDVLVIVAHRQSIAELSSARFVDVFAGRRGMLFVLNRADELTDSDRAALLTQLRVLATERFRAPDAPVLAVSARQAQHDPSAPEWAALVAALHALATQEAVGGVRRRNALGAVARVAGIVRDLMPEAEGALDTLERTTREGLAAWRAEVSRAAGERLEHRASDLGTMLWNDAAKGWDGPGGYALRAGGLATAGLGAGAALARHNPALAAGAAVGALVVDRARGALRERSFQSTSGLLPGAGELERWQRERLSAARLAAEEAFWSGAGGQSEAATELGGVPEATALADVATQTVEEAWDQLLAVELPAAARAALPRAVPWLVDVPVYALAMWIVYRAAHGLVYGSYVGVEFLATVAIVGGAWLFVCRSLVRRALERRGARLLGAVRGQLDERLTDEESALVEAQRRRLAGARAALQRLGASDSIWRERLRA
ncbi:MAG: dynamin family protein [Planctomycetota bacterium]